MRSPAIGPVLTVIGQLDAVAESMQMRAGFHPAERIDTHEAPKAHARSPIESHSRSNGAHRRAQRVRPNNDLLRFR